MARDNILFNQGDGSFAQEIPFAMSDAGAFGIAAGDLDGDAEPELVVANGNWTVGVLLNPGNGSFAQEFTYAAGGGASTLAVADFNDDGHPDLAVAASPNAVSVLINDGDGTFAPPVTFPLRSANQVNVIVAGDFNDDGHPDLACTFFQSHGIAAQLLCTSPAATTPEFHARGRLCRRARSVARREDAPPPVYRAQRKPIN